MTLCVILVIYYVVVFYIFQNSFNIEVVLFMSLAFWRARRKISNWSMYLQKSQQNISFYDDMKMCLVRCEKKWKKQPNCSTLTQKRTLIKTRSWMEHKGRTSCTFCYMSRDTYQISKMVRGLYKLLCWIDRNGNTLQVINSIHSNYVPWKMFML